MDITTEGKRHRGGVLGSQKYKDKYCKEKVAGWQKELETLSEILKSQPQAAYTAHTKRYRSKFTYFMRTIDSFEDYVEPIHKILHDIFLPTIFGQDEQFPKELKELLSLSLAQGSLGIPLLKAESPIQYTASTSLTSAHAGSITW